MSFDSSGYTVVANKKTHSLVGPNGNLEKFTSGLLVASVLLVVRPLPFWSWAS